MSESEAGRRATASAGSQAPLRVLWNPAAGRKGGLPTGGADEQSLRDALESHGLRVDLLATESEDDCRQQAREAVADGCRVVVAAGGDGTIGAVAEELLHSDTALGMLPLGSVMNIPRMLGIPRDLDGASAALAAGSVRAVDVGEANGRLFYEAASVGMNAAMFREAQRFDEGDYSSPLRTMWVALRYRPARMRLHLDEGMVRIRALMITVSNGPYTGMGLTVAPEARLDDGRFDVVVFRHYSKFELLRHLGAIAFGRRRYTPHARTYRSALVRVESSRPLPCRADSHDLGTTPLECKVRRASLRVVVGPSFGQGAAQPEA
ncbi:MAG TPA: diacylglycerol kinase family protein [Candidatus Limnocylindria bacterium]|nr:diacylglycerol kinase family protein [Candidatus Limnocylindria bacterium]